MPPALKVVADELFTSRQWNATGGTDDQRLPATNTFWNLYQPLVSAYLGTKAGLANSSDTAWYLLTEPSAANISAFGIAYLDDREQPNIEFDPQPFNLLGIQVRGYTDFGVVAIDPKGGVKSDGA